MALANPKNLPPKEFIEEIKRTATEYGGIWVDAADIPAFEKKLRSVLLSL